MPVCTASEIVLRYEMEGAPILSSALLQGLDSACECVAREQLE